jgi:predicted Zn-dependent protease
VLLAGLALPATGWGQSQLPTLGDAGDLSAAAERRLGDKIVRQLYRDPDYLDDPVLVEYVQSLWQPLLAAARQRGELSQELDERFAWDVLLGRDRTINAFALPGGYFGVHLGLLGVVATPDELASVLAHELSHVTQRHISRFFTQQNQQTPLVLATMILATIAASKSPGAAEALAVGGQALAVQNQLNFSRDMEREADRIGYSLMEPAGFAPQGFVTMFEKLQQANRLNDNGSWPYLRSHPLTSDRMADMQSRLNNPANSANATPPMAHTMASARAQLLANAGPDALRQWAEQARAPGFAKLPAYKQAAVLYGAALASSKLQDHAAAQRWLVALNELAKPDPAASRLATLLKAETLLTARQYDAALQALPPSTGASKRPELLLRTQTLIALGRSAEVTGDLQTWVSNNPRDAGAWQALASAWQAQGQALRAIRAEAEVHAVRYDYAAAVDRFKAGQLLARSNANAADHIEASIIDTRLNAVQLLLREQARER